MIIYLFFLIIVSQLDKDKSLKLGIETSQSDTESEVIANAEKSKRSPTISQDNSDMPLGHFVGAADKIKEPLSTNTS